MLRTMPSLRASLQTSSAMQRSLSETLPSQTAMPHGHSTSQQSANATSPDHNVMQPSRLVMPRSVSVMLL